MAISAPCACSVDKSPGNEEGGARAAEFEGGRGSKMSGQGCSGVGREISVGDPVAFASEMVKLVNSKEHRSA